MRCMQECAGRLLKVDCPAYDDGKQALYILKLMLVKMAHKDWTPIDRQWITSQAKRLRANMAAVCHFGCEGAVTDGECRASMSLSISEEPPELSNEIHCELEVPNEWMPLIHAAQQRIAASGESTVQMYVIEGTSGTIGTGM